jgi:hypothetical protein
VKSLPAHHGDPLTGDLDPLAVDLGNRVSTSAGVNMAYPFGFEGFENQEGDADSHPTHNELQSYSEKSLRSFAEIGQDEFLKMESHVSSCDCCQVSCG